MGSKTTMRGEKRKTTDEREKRRQNVVEANEDSDAVIELEFLWVMSNEWVMP